MHQHVAELVVTKCSDEAVRRFIETSAANFNPYAEQLSAQMLFDRARQEFGDLKCLDLLFFEH